MNIKPYLLILSFFLLFVNFSCGSVNRQQELAKIDTLQSWIQQAKERLILEEKIFAERKDTIEQRMKFIQKNYTDTVDWELQMLMTDYRGFHRAYRSFTKSYPQLKKENELHTQRIENLKKDVLEGNVSSEQFNEYYKKEKPIIKKHRDEVKETVGNILSMEPDYKRINSKIEDLYKDVRKKQKN